MQEWKINIVYPVININSIETLLNYMLNQLCMRKASVSRSRSVTIVSYGLKNYVKNCCLMDTTKLGLMMKFIGVYEIFTGIYEKQTPPPDQSNHSICYNYDLRY